MKRFEQKNLKDFNTFGIDYIAKTFIIVENYDDLKTLYEQGVFKDTFFILGGGSNVLFLKDFSGVVIKIDLKGIEKDSNDTIRTNISSYAGENWDDFVAFTIENGAGGLENLSLIPGSVGASAVQNIGAYGVEAKDFISEVEYFDIKTGKFKKFSTEDCKFGYRTSIFKTELNNRAVITKVTFSLKKDYALNLAYQDILNTIEQENLDKETLTAQQLRDMICTIRLRKLVYPQEAGNGGSFFKNPIISKSQSDEIAEQYPDIKPIILDENTVKIFAGWLIEKTGWKGWTHDSGRFGVSVKHALVLVNYGGSTGEEILDLSQKIKEDVFKKFKIQLEEEIVFVK